jgi:uncharacterized protein with PIN domain
VKFVADGMLGKLTRWLRMLGQDVEYSNQMDDAELLETSNKKRRVLLTRDLELYKRAAARNIETFYVEGRTDAEKVAEIAGRFKIPLKINMEKSRCPACNSRIKPILKKDVAEKVEKNTFAFYNEFWTCPKCRKIYWQGAHWGNIQTTLEKAKEILGKGAAG